MSNAKKENQITTTTKNELTLPSDMMQEFLQDCINKAGMENIDQRDYITPHICLVQALSPQRRKTHEAYIEGAVEGDFVLTSTKEILKSFNFIFVASQKKYMEYTINDKGQKDQFIAKHLEESILDTCVREYKGAKGYFTPAGKIIVPCRTAYVLLINEDGTTQRAIITFKNTGFQPWKLLNTMMGNQKIKVGNKIIPATCTYGFVYKAESKEETKKEGSFYNFSFTDLKQMVNEDQFKAAKAFYNDFKKNNIIEASEIEEAPIVNSTLDIPEAEMPF